MCVDEFKFLSVNIDVVKMRFCNATTSPVRLGRVEQKCEEITAV